MFGATFYWQTIRKYVSLFGTLFADISIVRSDTANNTTSFIKVPITYSKKEKMLARVQMDPSIQRPTATLPMPTMAFEMTTLTYDGDRKLNTINKVSNVANNVPTSMMYQYSPVAYNFGFNLYVMVKNPEDGTKIIEQILPYFTPDFTATLKLIPEMNIEMDIPTILNSIQQEDTYAGDMVTRQVLTWTLSFTIKGYLYGPVKSIPVIRFIKTAFYTPDVADGMLQTAVGKTPNVALIQIQPGLLANGSPTSNASLSINPYDIYATEDFGYVESITENLDTISSPVFWIGQSHDSGSTAAATGRVAPNGIGFITGAAVAAAMGATVTTANGAATGVSTAAGIGSPFFAAGTAHGTAAAAAIGQTESRSVGVEAGSSYAAANSVWSFSGTGTAVGTSTAASNSVFLSAGTVVGTSTAAAVGKQEPWAIGASSGTSIATGTAPTVNAVGSTAGTSRAVAQGAATAASIGTTAGVSTAAAVGKTVYNSYSVGTALSTSSASGKMTNAPSTAAGHSTAAAVGQTETKAAAVSTGTSTTAASGQTTGIAFGIGSAPGTSTASGAYLTSGVGGASGTSAASGHGNHL